MSLSAQCHIYAVGTDAFYNEREQLQHKRMLKLYKARQDKEMPEWKKKSVNRVIKKEKERLSRLLDNHLSLHEARELQPSALNDRNVISLFESSLTRALNIKTNELTQDIMIVSVFFFQVFEDLVKYGFVYAGEKYIFLTASAGQIRQKKAVFVKENAYKKVQMRLMCGLTLDRINADGGNSVNKYLAYLALNNSATSVWENFDIDRSVVVDDFETLVEGNVDYIDGITYEIKREYRGTLIPHMDGAGIMLEDTTRMARLPFIKGAMFRFPFDQFIREKCPNGTIVIKDIYGQEHDILGENIKYIFTKSQTKMWKHFKSWDEYKDNFKKYGCEACFCNIEEEYIPNARINYQMLQTLSDMKDNEIERLIKPTVKEIESIGQDFQTTMRLLGATEYNRNPSWFQEALQIYPELMRDPYCREILKSTKKSLVKQAKGGRLRVNGKYLFLSPDLYAFCEWLFLGIENPKGLLENGEVYCREFRDGDEVACLRSPHLYREWPIRINRRTEELDKWFGCTKSVYTSTHDLISRILQFDCDGDKTLIVKDRLLTKIAKRNMSDIVPLAYDLKKAKAEQLNADSMYLGMIHAYTGSNIGIISNNITKVWNSGNIGQEQLNVVKWLTFQNNAVIDYAKTLWLPTPPKEVEATIKNYTKAKVPDFFIYAKDKEAKQVEPPNNSTMNRIASAIPDPKLKFSKAISKFNYQMLMNPDVDFSINPDSLVIKSYDYWNARINEFEEDKAIKNQDMYKYQKLRERVQEESGRDMDYIVNTLVAYLYTVRKTSAKKGLWDGFGETILNNLKRNLEGAGKICPICGKRFIAHNKGQVAITCSESCSLALKNLRKADMRNS